MDDLCFMLDSMGLRTGVDLGKLLAVRDIVREALPDIEMHGALARAGLPLQLRERGRAHARLIRCNRHREAFRDDYRNPNRGRFDPAGRGLSRDPRKRAPHLRRLSRRLLARARGARGVSHRVRAGADRGGLPGRADPRGIRRRRPAAARGRRAILEEIHACGLQRGRLPCADVHHGHACCGTAAPEQKTALPAADRLGRAAAAGLRRHRADHRHRHHQAEDARRAQRRPLRRQRPEGLDLARAALRPDAAARAHHADRGGEEEDRGPVGVPGRHPRMPWARAWRSSRSRR